MEDHFGMNILLDATLASNPELAAASTTAGGISLHKCRVCGKTYERADHLNRHLKSHENARPFHCTRCPKRFNRADLLSRHLATHERNFHRDPERPLIKRADRAAEACLGCAASKSKCEDEKPCRRCRTRNIICETTSSTGPARSSRGSIASGELRAPSPVQGRSTNDIHPQHNSAYPSSSTTTDGSPPKYDVRRTEFRVPNPEYDGGMMGHQRTFQGASVAGHDIPAPADYGSNEPQMTSDYMALGDIHGMPFFPNVTEYNQDIDFGFWDFNMDGVQLPMVDMAADMMLTEQSTPSNEGISAKLSRNTSRGYAAFKRSPWLWMPAPKDNQLSDQADLALDEDSISIGTGPTPSSSVGNPGDFSSHNSLVDTSLRDSMYTVVVQMVMAVSPKSAPPSFPSLDIINHVIHMYFVRQSYQVDHWIHVSTFAPEKATPHLLLALISAGSLFVSVPVIWKMGLALQEVVRTSVGIMWESNNKTTRDLQSLQAYMICLDVGLWSGFKRKMEIAESLAQAVVTMLRRAGVFSAPRDHEALMPHASDSHERLEAKWRKWVERESYKRLAIHLFLHDTRASVALQKPPLLTISELNFSMPASRDLWLADTAAMWKTKYLAMRSSTSTSIPRMIDALRESTILKDMREFVDLSLCSVALLHGHWSQIWAFQEANKFYLGHLGGQGSATHQLLLTAHLSTLDQDIEAFSAMISALARQPSDMIIVTQLFQLTLYVSPDDLQRFAGKAGEEEASQVAIILHGWVQTDHARKAAWHAGQVLRAAKAMPPAELRDFYAIAVYFASLTLWAYGLLSNPGEEQESYGQDIPVRIAPGRDDPSRVSLDGPETGETRVFLSHGQGVPGLNYTNYGVGELVFEPLGNANMILKIARDIYRNNFPALGEPLPPLVENLGNLMRDLGSAPESRFSRSNSEERE